MGTIAVGLFVLAAPAAALAQQESPDAPPADPQATEPEAEAEQAQAAGPTIAPANLRVKVSGAGGATVPVGGRVRAFARLAPFVAGQKIRIMIKRGGKVLKRRNLTVKRIPGKDAGKVSLRSNRIVSPGNYWVKAVHRKTNAQRYASTGSRRFHPVYPDLDPGQRNSDVRLFSRVMRRQGYFTPVGKEYGPGLQRAVMAFRKVNNMSRSFNATPSIFRKAAGGGGGFRLNRPGAGRHVEVDISRQVMVLADRGKAQHIFHVSTGAPSTPSDRGSYRFYRRQPGFNSLGMYYSVYYNRGEAIHGYKSVPPYPASHGCIRNPIPNSRFIYDWVRIGMPIFVYT
jgi:L,D-transpeptidase catalytic domain